ncbi:hypothetical protein [Halosimplex salinum]|uniref:hypothetical protein n=1 Tax=Halosimplex salinum TaxID=1710538 RepID=UPI000F4A927A|nr:hypothetical protein [Halosimplex salinum]
MGERRTTDDRREDDIGDGPDGTDDPQPGAGASRPVSATTDTDTGQSTPVSERDPVRRSPGDARSAVTTARSADDRDTEPDRGVIETTVDRVTTVEPWTPPPLRERESGLVRGHLRPDESLQIVDNARLRGDRDGPATVALTDERLLVVADDGLVGVGIDRLCAVRSALGTVLQIRGNDARLLGGVGYLLSVVGFLAVLGVAANPLTPALALATVGGALATAHVRRNGLDLNGRTLTDRLARFDGLDRLADRLTAVERRVTGGAGDDPLAHWGVGVLGLSPFAALVVLEGGLLAPLLTLGTVASFAAVVHAVRHSEEFDGIEVVRRRQRTVTATVDDGSVVALRTHPDSQLDSELAARLGRASAGPSRPEDR